MIGQPAVSSLTYEADSNIIRTCEDEVRYTCVCVCIHTNVFVCTHVEQKSENQHVFNVHI